MTLSGTNGRIYEITLAYEIANNIPLTFYRDDPKNSLGDYSYVVGFDTATLLKDQASEMCTLIKDVLVENDHMANTTDIVAVALTTMRDGETYPGDHELFTGVKDVNADGDIGILTSKGFVFVSVKYGSPNVTLRNAGFESVSDYVEMTKIAGIMESHIDRMKELDFSGSRADMHEQFKAAKLAGDPRAELAIQSGLEARRRMAELLGSGMSKLDSESVRALMLDMAAPVTVYPTFMAHTMPSREEATHKVVHSRSHVEEKLSSFENFRVEAKSGTTCVTVKADSKTDGEASTMARISAKSRSGPAQTVGLNFTMPILNRSPRRKKRKLFLFDFDDTMFWYDPKDSPKVNVVKDGKVVSSLTPHEYNEYTLSDGESFDYTDHQKVGLIISTARPIEKILEKMRKLIAKGETVEICTARGFLDRPAELSDFLKQHRIEVPIHFAGERLEAPNSATRKKLVIGELVTEGKFDEVTLYDDNEDNLYMFSTLKSYHPDTTFNAFMVRYNLKKGTTSVRKMKWQA